jgi:predicted MFS family arabinose efflux permease
MVYGFQSVINFQIFVGWIPFIISLFLVEPDREVMSKASHKKNFQEVLSYIFVDHHFIRLIFINLVVWSLSTFIAVWIIQKYWQDNHIKLEQIGIFWMLCNLVAAVSGKYAHSFENKIGSRKVLVLMSLMPIVAYITMGFLPGLFGLGATLLFYVSRGINMVVMKEAFNHRIPSKFRNTANSLISLFFRLSFFVVGPLVGYSIDRFGMHLTLQGIGFCFALLFIFLMLPFLKKIPKA